MQRLSIARSLRLALTGLTIFLAVVAALGVASLYTARQRYDDALVRTSALAGAAANLASAAIAEQEVDRDLRGRRGAPARRQAAVGFRDAAARVRALAAGDPRSVVLARREIAARRSRRILAATAALENRQATRTALARARARTDSRRAVVLMIVAGALALIGALSLIRLLIRSMRGPLDALVAATRRLAEGDLTQTVEPSGPAELRDLGEAFNAMARDLQRATATLEQERARLATTIASLGDGLLVTAPDSTTVVAANPRAAVLVPEVPPGHRADAPESPLPPLAEAQAHEVTIEHAGRTLAVTAAPLGTADAHAGTVWTVRDISERARLEQAKSDFVATASHELRSPLTSIKGFVELLASAPGEMSARQREFVDIILRSTDRLVDLVNDLLDVARIEADHVEINRRPVDAGDAVREVVELMGPRVTDKRQTLECQVAPALPPAMADPARLRQIVANLLTNAHLYTPEGGRITVTADGDGPWVRVAISDTGIGMSAEEVERVFERFYRGSDGRTAPGTGLGLSIVKSLVDLHEGRIEVSSQPGAGTTFRVLIPSASTALGLAPSIDALRGRQVLVVDDEREVAQLIADQLTPFGLHCTIAGGGEEALEMLGRGGFDVVTLDVKMPGVSGFDVLRQIRAHPELRRTPVVFVSVFADHRRLRGEWVVSKPIDAEELRGVLSAAVSSGRSRVLVVARPELQETLERSLHDLGIEHQWATSGQAAARLCGERRFEIALIDIGLRNPQAVLHALDLRGRRVRRAVVLVADSASPVPPAIERLGLEVVPLTEAARVLQDAMRSDPGVAAR